MSTKYTPEPWPDFIEVATNITPDPDGTPAAILSHSDYSRAQACENACKGIDGELLADDCIRKTREDRDELLKQRDELLEALKAARRAIGDHHAPEDCYATGPIARNDYLDLVQCPACFAISKYDDAVSNSSGAPK